MLSSATPEEVNVQEQNTPQEKEVKEPHQGLSSEESSLQEEEATEEAAPKGDGSNQGASMTGALSDDIKAVVSTVFKEVMQKGEKQSLYMITVAMRRNSFLSRMVTNKRLVKQIQDFILYQLPQTTEAIPEVENSLLTSDYVVSLDTASSLVTGITRRRWSRVDNKVVTSQ